jgi:hypothetical protein
MDGWMDGWIDGWILKNNPTSNFISIYSLQFIHSELSCSVRIEGQTYRLTNCPHEAITTFHNLAHAPKNILASARNQTSVS